MQELGLVLAQEPLLVHLEVLEAPPQLGPAAPLPAVEHPAQGLGQVRL